MLEKSFSAVILLILIGAFFSFKAFAINFATYYDGHGIPKICDNFVNFSFDYDEDIGSLSGDIIGSPQLIINPINSSFYRVELEPLTPEDKELGIREICFNKRGNKYCDYVVIDPNDFSCRENYDDLVVYLGDEKNNHHSLSGFGNPVFTNDPNSINIGLYRAPAGVTNSREWQLTCSNENGQEQQIFPNWHGDFESAELREGKFKVNCSLKNQNGSIIHEASDTIFIDTIPPSITGIDPVAKKNGVVTSCTNHIAITVQADDGPKEFSSRLKTIDIKSDGGSYNRYDNYGGGRTMSFDSSGKTRIIIGTEKNPPVSDRVCVRAADVLNESEPSCFVLNYNPYDPSCGGNPRRRVKYPARPGTYSLDQKARFDRVQQILDRAKYYSPQIPTPSQSMQPATIPPSKSYATERLSIFNYLFKLLNK